MHFHDIVSLTSTSDDVSRLRFPRDIESAKDLGRLLSKYKDTHYYTVLTAVCFTYILYPHISVSSRHSGIVGVWGL